MTMYGGRNHNISYYMYNLAYCVGIYLREYNNIKIYYMNKRLKQCIERKFFWRGQLAGTGT